MRPVATVTTTLSMALALAGCGGSSDKAAEVVQSAKPVRSPATVPAPASASPARAPAIAAKTIAKFMTLVGTGDADQMAGLIKLAAPNSPAAVWSVVQQNNAAANLQSGQPLAERIVTRTGAGYRFCNNPGDTGASCATFSGFKTDSSGKLVSFKVQGTAIDGRVVGPGSPTTKTGVTWHMLGAYRSVQTNSLLVAVMVKAGAQRVQLGYQATYVSKGGVQQKSTAIVNSEDVMAGATSNLEYDFRATSPGGTLYINGYTGSGNTPFTVKLPL